ncbi:methionyl aminopeptidase [Maledivibacter halophilus]|uniref:Methionine aminopeptidase n=1 Tax=Maledivibacter halophilus TaxID=36842 RepID=A0A1T5IQG9_9FIRM|nr:methionyl aminopeptidase [Maledivibacter halophilus]SKC41332.1 methionine aminopeptidase, type I [Maledivibacter halophilus]
MNKLSRNDLCWCGSGKKYKKCHLEKDKMLERYESKGYSIPSRKLVKSPSQIESIKKSGEINKKIFEKLDEYIGEGITTNEINELVHKLTIENGGKPAPLNYNGFPKSVCTSINDVICHGIPDETALQEGDIINIDITTILDGYYADSSRMFTIGKISEKAKKLVQVAKECLEIGIRSINPYKTLKAQGEAIEKHAEENEFSVVRDLGGHGTGLNFHEEPFVHHYNTEENNMIIVPGMVFTIEPMINEGIFSCKQLDDNWTIKTVDGGLSAQWEHTVVVTDTGVEILT